MKDKFIALANAKIQEQRNLVISKIAGEPGFILVQQLVINEGKRKTEIFLKGAAYLDDLESLYNLRDALNVAIRKVEEK